MPFTNDMTMMYTMHAALRRDLDRIARLTARAPVPPADPFADPTPFEDILAES